jgi:hypothetical protein
MRVCAPSPLFLRGLFLPPARSRGELGISFMKLCLSFGLLLLSACLLRADGFAVLAIRQYQEVGDSNIHLYLYSLDGHLIRQLTQTPGFDDDAPEIDREGKTVFFSRSASTPTPTSGGGYYLLDLQTGKVTPVARSELKLEQKRREPTLKLTEFSWPSDTMFKADPTLGKDAEACSSADGQYTLIHRPNPAYNENNPGDEPASFYFLKTRGSTSEQALASLPGFQPLYSSGDFLEVDGSPFIPEAGNEALFLTRHVDSTAGNDLWALDLHDLRWTKMSDNAGLMYVVAGRSGMILIHSSRYDALGKTGKYVNCGYFEFWDAALRPTRLGPPTSLFHGGSVFYGKDRTIDVPDPEYGS